MPVAALERPTSATHRPRRSQWLTLAVVMVASLTVAVAVVRGWDVQADPRVKLGAAPLVGEWRLRLSWRLLPVAVLAGGAVVWLPGLAARLAFRRLLVVVATGASGLALALAASDGGAAVLAPVVHPTEYWANLATLPAASEVLREWGVDFLLDYSVHVKGHPPGFVLALQALDGIGLGAPWVAGALSFLGAGATAVAVVVGVRRVVSEPAARAVAPFAVVVPYLVWMGTSADAVFTAVTAWGLVAAVAALQATTTAARRILAAVAGTALAGALFLTYGTAMFLVLVVAVVLLLPGVSRRARAEVAAAASAAAAVVTLAFAAGGFWWFDGLRATQTLYWWGTAQFRPGSYFWYANLAAAMIAVGPAVVVGVASLRARAVWLLVGGALTALVLADLSQYSRAEVERIWLLFFPWLVPAVVALRRPRAWLAVQAVVTVGLQATLVSKW
jgi:hypothetical protein